jgi:hypothetical protein
MPDKGLELLPSVCLVSFLPRMIFLSSGVYGRFPGVNPVSSVNTPENRFSIVK